MSFKRMHKLKRLRSAEVPKDLRSSKSVKLTMLNRVQLPQTFRNQIVQNDLRSSARKYASLEHISCKTKVQDISYIRAIVILFVKAKSESRTVPKRSTKILFSKMPPNLRFEYVVHTFSTSFRMYASLLRKLLLVQKHYSLTFISTHSNSVDTKFTFSFALVALLFYFHSHEKKIIYVSGVTLNVISQKL